ncbi:bifunctional lysylphosphatidylglycerol flippase/synthetase MprF [Tessaracoccus antarcticus]|uniref:DUF2156 domain-containing protein n=1 Tax=Tessaracoccus antarcticus TaxID=2479848 RepID=A0A3M0GX66_9ACTN|nr:phosphatidylglycerol lysyltransferase domain-containing protein [Tessaracoccus antarcticus]RMB61966.1 DUF2156 domain-containing protein [Tessaracoccus antarcticus]
MALIDDEAATLQQSGAAGMAATAQLTRVRRNRRTRRWASALVLLLAVVNLASALSAPLRARLELLLEILPFPTLHTAAATTVFVGCALALTARGLLHGSRIAWTAAMGLLVVAVGLNLLKGLDVEEGVISAALVVWLALSRHAFTVWPTQGQLRRALVTAAVAFALAVSVSTLLVMTLGRRHHPHVGETLQASAERLGGGTGLPLLGMGPAATPLLTAVGIAATVAVLWLALSPRWALARTPEQHVVDRERARAIVSRDGGGTMDYFALRDDKEWFFTGNCVVAYAVRAGICLVAPDPVGPRGERYQAWADFMEFAARRGWAVVVVASAVEWLQVYEDSGLRSTYLGDEAIVDVTSFTLTGRAVKGLRQAVNRVERAGVRAEFIDPSTATPEVRDKVRAIAEKSRRGEAERGFSMTLSRLFDPADTGLLLVMALDATDRVLGFIQWVPAADLPGWSLDVMRRDTAEDVPNGLTDFLIVRTIEHIAEQGSRGLGLNFAVMRDTMTTPGEGFAGQVKRRVLDVVARHSQLESLGRFNEKYDPAWVPRYIMRGSGDQLLAEGLAVARAEGLIDVPTRGRHT